MRHNQRLYRHEAHESGGVMAKILVACSCLGYFVMSILQIAAITDGFQVWYGLASPPAFLVALILGPLPLIGTIMGTMGAHTAWEWGWSRAFMSFSLPMLFICECVILCSFFISARRGLQS
jgi:hypothetical protein